MQHDMVLDDAAGAAFRADANNAVAALASNNSGASAPSVTYAFMWWADTSTNLLKQRNSANSAWITIGDMTLTGLGLLSRAGGALTGMLQTKKGADIASGTTVDLGTATGNDINITHSSGTTAITGFGGASSIQSSTRIRCRAVISGGTLNMTHNGTSNILPTAGTIAVQNGDSWDCVKNSDSNAYWRVENYTRADGSSLGAVSNVGEAFFWPHNDTPSYGLLMNGAAVSRATYAALFAKIGTLWGVDDGSTTFNLPNVLHDQTAVQASADEGTSTVGDNLSHTHTHNMGVSTPGGGTVASGSGLGLSPPTINSSGGSYNLPAGIRGRWCIRF